jgi:hypothetical protein
MAFPPQALISFKKYIPPSSSLLNEEEGAYIFLMKQMPVISTLKSNLRKSYRNLCLGQISKLNRFPSYHHSRIIFNHVNLKV